MQQGGFKHEGIGYRGRNAGCQCFKRSISPRIDECRHQAIMEASDVTGERFLHEEVPSIIL